MSLKSKILFLIVLMVPFSHAFEEHPFTIFTGDQIVELEVKMNDGIGLDDAQSVRALANAQSRLTSNLSLLFGSVGSSTSFHVQDQAFASYFAAPAMRVQHRDKCVQMAEYLVDNYHPDNTATNDYPEQDNPSIVFALAFAYDMCYNHFAVNSPEKVKLRTEIEAYLNDALSRSNWVNSIQGRPNGNFWSNVGGMLVIGTLVVQDEGTNTQLYEDAYELGDMAITKVIANTFGPDGGESEGVLYALRTLEGMTYGAVAAYNYDGTDYYADPRMENSLEWFAYNLLPEGNLRYHNWNDMDTYSPVGRTWHMFHSYALKKYATPLSKWVYINLVGTLPSDPVYTAVFGGENIPDVPVQDLLPSSKLFSSIGQYFYRSGWNLGTGSDDVWISFYSGNFWGGHNQEDKNSFSLIAYGQRQIVDTGDSKGAGACSDPGSSTEGHNLLLIDIPGDFYLDEDGNQVSMGYMGQAKASGSCGTDGYIRSSILSSFADYLHGDAREAYYKRSPLNPSPGWDWCDHAYNGGTNGAPSCAHPRSMERANRHVIVTKPSADFGTYIILADDTRFDANAANKYHFFLHTEYKETGVIEKNTWDFSQNPIKIVDEVSGLPEMDLYWISPQFSPSSFIQAYYDTSANEGNNQDGANMRLRHAITSGNPQWFMIFYPYETGMPRPSYSPISLTQGSGAMLTSATTRDYVFYAPANQIQGPAVSGTAKIAVIREEASIPDQYMFIQTEGFTLNGNALVSITGDLGNTASIVSDGEHVDVSGSLMQYTLYGPNVETASSKGMPLPIYKGGDYRLITQTPPPLCQSQGGFACGGVDECPGSFLFSSDSDFCCTVTCEGGCPGTPPDHDCSGVIEVDELLLTAQDWFVGLIPMDEFILILNIFKNQ